ncbi:P-loop containing nucleoside triphosphate hydrolase protein [Mycena filopes]|nr:P-loop containing nucleoside triphosphate hydrolase protein [Mycena filopes]
MRQLHVSILGDEKVGRQSFASQFALGSIMADEGDPYRRAITVDGRECFVEIEPHQSPAPPNAEAVILMYSVASRESFAHLETHAATQKTRYPAAAVVLVGNRLDADRNPLDVTVEWRRRQVSTEEGEEAARKLGCPFAETSAKTGEGVNAVVEELVRAVGGRKEGVKKRRSVQCALM